LEGQGHDLLQGSALTFACYDRRNPQTRKASNGQGANNMLFG